MKKETVIAFLAGIAVGVIICKAKPGTPVIHLQQPPVTNDTTFPYWQYQNN